MKLRVVKDRADRIRGVPAQGEALPHRLGLAGVEREKDGDCDRHDRPDEIAPSGGLQEPRMSPRIAPKQGAGTLDNRPDLGPWPDEDAARDFGRHETNASEARFVETT